MADEQDDIRSASRALKDAAAAFSRAFGQVLTEAGTQASREIADELRQATKDLNEAVAVVGIDLSGPRRSPKAERTRGELLDAARRVFAEKGYEGASVGDVAAAAGYTKGAVYANFGSKEELFLELARGLLAQDAALKDSPPQDLPEMFAEHQDDERATQTLLGLEMYLYAIRHPEARADLASLLAAAQDGIATLVHRSRPGGGPGDPVPEDYDLAFSMVALHTLGALVGPLLPGGAAETEATVRRLVGRLLESE